MIVGRVLAGFLAALALAAGATAFARGGDYDSTFGAGGIAPLPAGQVAAVQLQPDGSTVIVFGTSFAAGQVILRLGSDGNPDPAFGPSGRVTLDPAFPFDIQALAMQADGRIVVAGSPRAFSGICARLRVARLDARGTLDKDFGAGGFWESPCAQLEMLLGVKVSVLDDGRIMAIGYPFRFWSTELLTPFIVRLDASGRPDAAYGAGGMARAPFGNPYDQPDALISGDGSVEFVRDEPQGPGQGYAVLSSRLRADGTVDAMPGGPPETRLDAPGLPLQRVALLADRTRLVSAIDPEHSNLAIVARYGPDHRPVAGFGVAGVATIPVMGNSRIQDYVATPDGGLLLLLSDRYVFESFVLFKVDGSGRLDPAFGAAGRRDISIVPGPEGMSHLLMQRDGYAVLVGNQFDPVTGAGPGFAARIQAIGDVVEFFHAGLGHYFMSIDDSEARGIDAGAAGAGWARTGLGFRPGGTAPLCRFYGTPGIGPNSHFYTADRGECEAVKRDRGWTYEGLAFHVNPVTVGGCAPPLRPVHRLYNNRWMFNDSNHRYVTDTSLIPPMEQAGWIHEGVAFCAKP